jgi:hypothetical protein
MWMGVMKTGCRQANWEPTHFDHENGDDTFLQNFGICLKLQGVVSTRPLSQSFAFQAAWFKVR